MGDIKRDRVSDLCFTYSMVIEQAIIILDVFRLSTDSKRPRQVCPSLTSCKCLPTVADKPVVYLMPLHFNWPYGPVKSARY